MNPLQYITRGSPQYNAADPWVDPATGIGSNPFDAQLGNVSMTQYGPEFWQSLGFQGEPYSYTENGAQISPELAAFIQQSGIQPGVTPWGNGQYDAALTQNGAPIDGSGYTMAPNDNAFWNAALAAGAITGANMWDAGMLGGGAAAGGAEAGGSPFAGFNTATPDFSTMFASGAPEAGSAAGGYGGLTGGGALTGGAAGGAAGGGMGYGNIAGLTNFAAPDAAASWLPGLSNSTTAYLGSNILNGFLGSRAADKSAQALTQAGQESNALQKYIFDTARADNKPLLDMRNSVLPQIQGLLSNPSSITSDPGYQFQFAEGQKALNNGAAARGMTYSGAQGKALQRYGQDYGATKLDQSLNRLTNVAGLGQVGATNNQQAGQQYGQTVGNTLTDMGSARGSAYVGGANSWGNALGNFGNALQMEEILKRYPRP